MLPRFYLDDAPVPEGLQTDDFVLRPLRASDCDRDYDAVMASAELLLVKSNGRWPRPGFTWDENLKDLQEHEADHLARRAFTYTVMTPDETRCLGCVYLNPLRDALRSFGADESAMDTVGGDEAAIHFWARQDELARDLDRRLFDALRPWLAAVWDFRRALYRANDGEERLLQFYAAAGLRAIYTLPTRPQATSFFG